MCTSSSAAPSGTVSSSRMIVAVPARLLGDRRTVARPASGARPTTPRRSGQLVGAGAAQRVRERRAHGGDDLGRGRPGPPRSPANGVTTYGSGTLADPPPSARASLAPGPITATRRRVSACSGRSPSLRSRTAAAAAASRASGAASSIRPAAGFSAAGSTPSRAPARAASRRIRRTFASIAASGTRPSRTASTSGSRHCCSGPGIVEVERGAGGGLAVVAWRPSRRRPRRRSPTRPSAARRAGRSRSSACR